MNSVAFNPKTKKHEARVAGRLLGVYDTGREGMVAVFKATRDSCPVVYHPDIKPAEPDRFPLC
jgi:hypothetical protein